MHNIKGLFTIPVLTLALAACGGGGEPSESEMKDALNLNNTARTITSLKKESCREIADEKFRCFFSGTASADMGSGNIRKVTYPPGTAAEFERISGNRWKGRFAN